MSGLWSGLAGFWSGSTALSSSFAGFSGGGGLSPSSGSGPPPPSGMPFPTVTTAPTVRLHSGRSTIAQSGGRATSVSDLQGNPSAVNSTGVGPFVLTDEGGWPFLRFNSNEYLSGGWSGGSGVTFDVQNSTIIMVCCVHRSRTLPLWSVGNVEQATGQNTSNALMRTITTGTAPAISLGYLASSRAGIPAYASNQAYMLPGCQLQVIAVRSSTANVRTYVNKVAANSTANSNITTGVQGYEVGRNAALNSPGATGTWGQFDLYDMLAYNTALSDAALDQVVSELVTGYGIPAVTGQILAEGDSLTFGLNAPSGSNPAMAMCARGASWAVPANYRVINIGVSGNTIADLIARRDFAISPTNEVIPGGDNVISVMIGTNDIDGGADAATTYGRLVGSPVGSNGLLITGTGSGYLQKGGADKWRVAVCQLMAYNNATFQTRIEAYRPLIAASQFLTDTQSNTGQTYDGKVRITNIPAWTVNGQTVFSTLANAQNINGAGVGGSNLSIYFDTVHLTALGNLEHGKARAVNLASTTLNALSLSSASVPQGSPATINIVGATAGSTIAVQSGSLPTGMTLDSAARTISGTPSGSGLSTFTLRETLAGAVNSPRDTAGLQVNVATAPTLGALSLSASSVTQSAPSTVNINGATTGSTISVQSGSLPAGMTLDSGARTISGTPTTVSSNSFTLRETLAGATNTPNDTPLSLDVAASGTTGFISSGVTSAGSGASVTIAVPAGAQSGDLLLVWGVTGTGAEYQTPAGWTQHLSSTGFTIHTLPSWDGATASYTFTTTGSTSSPQALAMLVYRGFDFNDVGTLSAPAAGSVTPATLTVTENGSINLNLAGGVGAARTFTMTTGWTSRADIAVSRSLNVFQRDATVSAGSLAGVAVTGSSGNNRVVQVALGPR